MNTNAGTTHNAAAQPAPLERMGRYRLLGRLGQGGMGTIHLGVSVGLADFRKLLVVKELRPELTTNEHFVQMFLGEAKLAARLQHPNIVQTLEAGQDGERFFLAMEFLDGQPLSELLKRSATEPVVSLPMRMHVLCEVLAGLHYAHELRDFDETPFQIVHRDVNPQNVFITYDGHVKLLDFGIAKVVDSELCTTAGVFKGKFPYAAPEQVDCRKVDRRADVFAVGVMLWEMIAQRRFAPGQPTMQGIDARLAGTEPRIAEAQPGLDPELAVICDRAMHVDPEQRYASADAFRADLHAYLAARSQLCTAAEVGEVLRQKFESERTAVHRLITTHVRQLAPDEELGDSLVRALTRGGASKSGLTPVDDPVTGTSTGSSRTARERPSVTRQRDLPTPTPTSQRLFMLRRRRQARTRRLAGLAGAALLAFGGAYLWVSRQTASSPPHAVAGPVPRPPEAAPLPPPPSAAPAPPSVELAHAAAPEPASAAPVGSKPGPQHAVRRAGPVRPQRGPEASAQPQPQAASVASAREAPPRAAPPSAATRGLEIGDDMRAVRRVRTAPARTLEDPFR